MAGGKIKGANVVAIQVDGDVMVEGENGERLLGGRFAIDVHRPAITGARAALQPFADIVVRDNGRLLLEVLVSPSVIGVVVSVDDKADGLVGNAFQSGLNFLCQRGVLIVDHDNSVIANGGADVAAGAFEHVDVSGDFRDLHLHFAEVLVLGNCHGKSE